MVFTLNAIPIKSTLDETDTNVWAALVGKVVTKARAVGNSIQDDNDLTIIRIRTTKTEVMIAPGKDYVMVAIHKQIREM